MNNAWNPTNPPNHINSQATLTGGDARARTLACSWACAWLFVFAVALSASAGNESATLDQAANGALNFSTNAASISPVDWENGDQGPTKSHYIEGQSVPYRMVLDNLTNGQHTLDIEWD